MIQNELQSVLTMTQFPLSAKYDVNWLNENEMGPCSIWLMEFLSDKIEFRPNMRVLDMGCGKAISSIFLAKEFGVRVYANDLWISATENWKRIVEAGVEDLVTPIHAEAHNLPYAKGFFDVIVSADSYHYYGTDELFLSDFVKYLKVDGQIGMVTVGLKKEFDQGVPQKIKPFWEPDLFTLHTPNWWSNLWERSETVKIEISDSMPNGFENWLKWDKTLKEAGVLNRNGDVELLEADNGEYFDIIRLIARRGNNTR